MTEREPYLALRDFQVWFQKHRGFIEALRRSDPGYIKAVDGINLTIGKGEIYCLVGESGCGKTTTGKGILRLVEPTGGDVFLNPTAPELKEYEESKAKNDKEALERLRQRRSLVYKETAHRTPKEWLIQILLTLGGVVLGGLLATIMVLTFRSSGRGSLEILAYLAIGLVIAFVGTLPWLKMSRYVPPVLSLLAVPTAIATQIFVLGASLAASTGPVDAVTVLLQYGGLMQQNDLFFALGEIGAAALTTWWAFGFFHRFWDRRHGVVTDRLRTLRTRLQIIFQDPYESLNPRHTIYDIVAEPLVVNRITRGRAETEARVEQALEDAGMRPPKEYLLRFPHELSGGQRQRVSIAGALVLEPEFLVADEPVSMLDVSIRTEIIELLLELRQKKGLTYLFITHDLSLAYVLADRIGVMYLGKIVEEGPTDELVAHPRHPYTSALISVVPIPDPDRRHVRTILKGERPDPSDIPAGCRFHPRCPVAFERCGWTSDEVLACLRELASGEAARFTDGASARGPVSIGWALAPPALEGWLRELVATKSEDFRALKSIQRILVSGSGATVTLHPFEEPTLKPVSGTVLVSCHLYP